MTLWGGTGRFSKRVVALACAVGVVLAMAAPPSGAYVQNSSSGTTAIYVPADDIGSPGVTCRLQANTGVNNDNLASIKIKGFYAHANAGSQTRKVGYRYVIQKKAAAASTYSTMFSSAIVKQSATSLTPTLFADRTYTFAAPAPNDGARYRVQIKMFWYMADGVTVNGKATGTIEVYDHVMSGASSYKIGSEGSGGYCKANFHF